jgi:hypothetical protein
MKKASDLSREKIVYSASDQTISRSDLVTGMGLRFSEFMDVAHQASKRQIQIGVRGFANPKYTTLERFLKTRERNGKLRVAWMKDSKHGTIKVYAKPQKTRNFDPENFEDLYHGYCCTECLIRFMTAKEGEAIPEKYFRGYGRVPEFGMRYENGKLLLLEFSTKHDVGYTGKLRGKLNGYDDCLSAIERDFSARSVVVFVLDVDRDRVRTIVDSYKPSDQFFFTDFDTFKRVPMGQALIAPIYIWKDGKEYPLI